MNVFFVLSFALYVPTLICSKNLFLSLGSNPGYCRIEVRCWPLSCTTFFSLVHPIPSFLDCSLSKLKEPFSSFWWLSFRESANHVTTFFGVKSNSIGKFQWKDEERLWGFGLQRQRHRQEREKEKASVAKLCCERGRLVFGLTNDNYQHRADGDVLFYFLKFMLQRMLTGNFSSLWRYIIILRYIIGTV